MSTEDEDDVVTVTPIYGGPTPTTKAFIFTVTAVCLTEGKRRRRTWGWFPDFEGAEEATVNNYTDMNEAGYYPHIVVEKVGNGILPITMTADCTWYLFNEKTQKYERIETPKETKSACNWSIG